MSTLIHWISKFRKAQKVKKENVEAVWNGKEEQEAKAFK